MNASRKSLNKIFDGFSRLTKKEKIAYLKYLIRVIERRENLQEKNRLISFKTRLEKAMKNHSKPLKIREKEAV